MPVLAIIAQGLILRLTEGDRQYSGISHEWRAISSLIQRTRPDTDITIFRHDLMVIYSTNDDFISGETGDFEKLRSIFTTVNSRYGYTLSPPLAAGYSGFCFVTDRPPRVPASESYSVSPHYKLRWWSIARSSPKTALVFVDWAVNRRVAGS